VRIFPEKGWGLCGSSRGLPEIHLRYFRFKVLFTILLYISLIFYPLLLASPVFAASATLIPTSGYPGTEITVKGYTLGKNNTGWVWFDSDGDGVMDTEEPQQSVTTNLFGYIETTLIAPSLAPGSYYIRIDVPSGGTIELSPVFDLYASAISVDPESGLGGIEITVTGGGFPAATPGRIWFDSNGDDIRDTGEPQTSVTTDGDGAIPAGTTITADSVAEGIYSVLADIPEGGSLTPE
jgi:hypothetical protein